MAHSSINCVFSLAGFIVAGASGCDSSGQPVGPEGGVVFSEDGRLSLTIPPEALDQEVDVSIVMEEDGPEDSLGPAYALEPLALGFQRPATVRYDTDGLAMGALSMSDVALVVKKEDTWFYLADQRASGSEVAATAIYLSTYAVIGFPGGDDDVKDHDPDDD